MALILRQDDELPPDATVLIQMGAGDVAALFRSAVTNYPEYRELRSESGFGYFTLSIVAVRFGVSEEELVMEAFDHRRFARATAAELSEAGFQLLATSDFARVETDADRLAQESHYDILLPDIEDERLREIADVRDDEELVEVVRSRIEPSIEQLVSEVFNERIDKYNVYGKEVR